MSHTLITGRVWPTIQAAASRGTSHKYAAVAYIGGDGPALLSDFGAGDIVVCNAGKNALRAGATSPSALETLTDRGISVYSNDRLHAKVYVLGGVAIIGSANASANAASLLEEAAITTTDRTIAGEARQFIKAMCRAGTAVDSNFILYARAVYRPPRGGASRSHQAGKKPRSRLPLLVASFDGEDAPKAVEAHYQKHCRERQTQAGPAARWSVDISWDPDPRWVREGDWVLWICDNVEPKTILPPMKVLSRDAIGGRSTQIVTWFQAPALKTPLLLDHVRGRILAKAGYTLKNSGRVTDAGAVAELFSLWHFTPGEDI